MLYLHVFINLPCGNMFFHNCLSSSITHIIMPQTRIQYTSQQIFFFHFHFNLLLLFTIFWKPQPACANMFIKNYFDKNKDLPLGFQSGSKTPIGKNEVKIIFEGFFVLYETGSIRCFKLAINQAASSLLIQNI